jgi:sugar lactone lactonase YvrE
VAADSSGNVYVADTGNDTIRKIATDGTVTTLAGLAGTAGHVDGTGSAAYFSSPTGLTVDPSGNVYVVDIGNYLIRKVTSGGVVTTVAGSPLNSGSADGTGVTAWFNGSVHIAADASGNLFLADAGNSLIRKITPDGVVTTIGGLASISGNADGTGIAARFFQASGVAVDSSGAVYVADTYNNTIRKGVAAGSGSGSSTSSSTGSGSSGSSSSGSSSSGSSGTSGSTSGTDTSGSSSSSSGSGSSGTSGSSGSSSSGYFIYPTATAVDSAGNLYVADASMNVIRKITSTGVIGTLAGSAGVAGSQDGTGSAALFNQPNSVAVDSSGNVYVADTGNATIRRISSSGVVVTLAGAAASRGNVDGNGTAARFSSPIGVTVDSLGGIYVVDAFTDTVRKVTAGGTVTTLAGTALARGEADGTGSAASFNDPSGVTVDATGNLYVADTYNDTIRKIDSANAVTTLAGSAGISGGNDGTGIYALFNQPVGVAADSSGNVYVADTGNGTIRKVAPAGGVTTVAGIAGIAGSRDGDGTGALFNQPRGLSLDDSGNLYVADTGNAAIRKITSAGVVTTVTVTTSATTTTSNSTSSSSTATASAGGGGGGAMETWILGALALLGLARWLARKSWHPAGR